MAYLSVRLFFGLVLPKGVLPNKWKNSGIRGGSGHARAALSVDPVPPVFVEQTYWDHYSVASRARHHLWCANHTRNHTNQRNHTAARPTPRHKKTQLENGFQRMEPRGLRTPDQLHGMQGVRSSESPRCNRKKPSTNVISEKLAFKRLQLVRASYGGFALEIALNF